MEDLSQKISELLSNPESLEQIKNMASMFTSGGFGGSDKEESSSSGQDFSPPPSSSGLDDLISPQMLLKVKEAYESMGNTNNDNVNLLLALRPHLSEKRKEKVDLVVKLIRLSKLKGLLGDFLK